MRPLAWPLVALVTGCSAGGLTGQKFGNDVTQVEAVIGNGQSQMGGAEIDLGGANDPPAGLPDGTIAYLRRDLVGSEAISDTSFTTMRVTTLVSGEVYHSLECQLTKNLFAGLPSEHRRIVYLKINANGSAIVDWIGAGAYVSSLHTAVDDFKARIAEQFPLATVRYHLVHWQGTNESKQATETAALAWGANYAMLHADLESRLGQTLRPHLIKEWTGISGGNWVATVNAQKDTEAAALNGYALDTDAIQGGSGRVQSDGVHPTGLGSNEVGALAAASILADIAAHP